MSIACMLMSHRMSATETEPYRYFVQGTQRIRALGWDSDQRSRDVWKGNTFHVPRLSYWRERAGFEELNGCGMCSIALPWFMLHRLTFLGPSRPEV